MIYRLLLCGFLFTGAFIFVSAGVLAERMLSLVYQRQRETFWSRLLAVLFARRKLWAYAAVTAVAALALVWAGLVQYATTGHVTLHWSRVMVAVFLLQTALLAVVHAVTQEVVSLWKGQLDYNAARGPSLPSAPRDIRSTPRARTPVAPSADAVERAVAVAPDLLPR
jgi:hypothetical protein